MEPLPTLGWASPIRRLTCRGMPVSQWVPLRPRIAMGLPREGHPAGVTPTTGRPATRVPSMSSLLGWFTPTLGGPHVPCGRGSGSGDRVKGSPLQGPCVWAVYQDRDMSAIGGLGKEGLSEPPQHGDPPNNIKALPTLNIPCSHGVPSQKWGSVCSTRTWDMEAPILVYGDCACGGS